MKKSLLLIGAVLIGMVSSAIAASAHNCGCYAETRAEGISLCERGLHQRAIEFFVAAKNCNDVPSGNDLDALIAKCRGHLSDFSISMIEFCNTDEYGYPEGEYGDELHENSIYYIKPRITYNSSVSDSLEFGIKFIKPDGTLAGKEDAEFSYIQKVWVDEGSDKTLAFWAWGSSTAGSFLLGTHTVEIWKDGKCLASEQFTVLEDVEEEPKLFVNGETSMSCIFPIQGGRTRINVTNDTGREFIAWLLPEFCEVENQDEYGFELVCEPNKTPVYREDYLLVSDSEYDYNVRISVSQESYADPSMFIIDNKAEGEEINSTFECFGGKELFIVDTDSPDYIFWEIPSFCSIEKKNETSFLLVCEENPYTEARGDWFKVMAGKFSVVINVYQEGNPNGESSDAIDILPEGEVSTDMGSPNYISEPENWLETLSHMMENPVKKYSDGSSYKGLLNDKGIRDGYGVYYWPVKTYYFGEWKNGMREGWGIYIIGDFKYQFNNCPNCVVYVGEFKNSLAHGIGSCYDKEGNLLYDGEFIEGVPQDDYPNGDQFEPGYKFQIFHTTFNEGQGQYYLGETYGTDRHGWGVLIWDDFDCCFGRWSMDQRSSEEAQLFMDRAGKEIEMRQY